MKKWDLTNPHDLVELDELLMTRMGFEQLGNGDWVHTEKTEKRGIYPIAWIFSNEGMAFAKKWAALNDYSVETQVIATGGNNSVVNAYAYVYDLKNGDLENWDGYGVHNREPWAVAHALGQAILKREAREGSKE